MSGTRILRPNIFAGSSLSIPSASPAPAGGIDLTTFTKVDSASDITVNSSTKVTVDTMQRVAVSGLYKDMGAGYATGDFEFQWYFYINFSVSFNSVIIYGALSEAFYLTRADKVAASDGLEVYFQHGTGLGLADSKSSEIDIISVVSEPPFGWWATLSRVGTTVTFKIYTDSERTSLVGTATITQSSAYAYRYFYAVTSLDLAGDLNQSGYIQDIVKI